jgi:hypothetical protein
MRRLGLLFLSALGLALPGGCTRDTGDGQIGEKLDMMIKKQEETNNLLRDMGKGGGRGMGAATGGAQAGGERKRPDPNEVYAVPAVGASVGPKDAKVTLVEAFDFA